MTLLAFHNDHAIQQDYLARVRAHRAADEIVQGMYIGTQEDGRAGYCGVGCTIHSSVHTAYETELGIPVMLAYLEDRLFEGLPLDEAKEWPLAFLEAVPLGADLSRVGPQFLLALMGHLRESVVMLEITPALRAHVTAALAETESVLRHWVEAGAVDPRAAESAASAAWSAERAAWSAARAEGAARSAESAAWSAESAAWSAESAASAARAESAASAESAARAASAESAAWREEYRWTADTLLDLLRAAPVPTGQPSEQEV